MGRDENVTIFKDTEKLEGLLWVRVLNFAVNDNEKKLCYAFFRCEKQNEMGGYIL